MLIVFVEIHMLNRDVEEEANRQMKMNRLINIATSMITDLSSLTSGL
jgi:hypothetical protein